MSKSDERNATRFHASSPAVSIRSTWSKDKQYMARLDRRCTRWSAVIRTWGDLRIFGGVVLDPHKWPGSALAEARREFAKEDAKRKALRHKMKGVKPR
jgi:hypothetical protein